MFATKLQKNKKKIQKLNTTVIAHMQPVIIIAKYLYYFFVNIAVYTERPLNYEPYFYKKQFSLSLLGNIVVFKRFHLKILFFNK